MLSIKSPRIHEQVQKAYTSKDNEVKKSAKKDKRAFVEEIYCQAECSTERGQFSAVYKITKRLCGGNKNQSAQIKDKNGNMLSTEREQANRWVQHFCYIFMKFAEFHQP